MSAPLPPAPAPEATDPRRLLLLQIGGALLAGSLPTADVEDELRALGRDLEVPDARIAAWPTGLFVCLGPQESTGFEPVGAVLRFDQTSGVLEVIRRLRAGELNVHSALVELARIRSSPPPWPLWVSDLAAIPVGIGLCLLLQPAPSSLLVGAAASVLVAGLSVLARWLPIWARLLPVVSGFLVALLVLAAYQADLVDGPLRTIVAVLAILLPGSAIVTGLAEVASGAPAAGSSRLVAGSVQLVLFLFGVVGAAMLLGVPLHELGDIRVGAPPWWAAPLGIALATAGLVLFLYPPLTHIGPVVLGVLAAAGAQVAVATAAGPALGGLAGSLTAAIAAILLSWLPRGPAWQVTYMPAFIIVAPGSFAFLNASQLQLGDGAGAMSALIAALATVMAIAIGTLIGAVLARASDRVVRRRPAPLPGGDGAERA